MGCSAPIFRRNGGLRADQVFSNPRTRQSRTTRSDYSGSYDQTADLPANTTTQAARPSSHRVVPTECLVSRDNSTRTCRRCYGLAPLVLLPPTPIPLVKLSFRSNVVRPVYRNSGTAATKPLFSGPYGIRCQFLWRKQANGLPQRSVLDSTLFNLYTNDLPVACSRMKVD